MKNKHILTYRDFIFEQMMDPMAGAMGGAPAAAPTVKEKPFHFIFLDKSDLESHKSKKYPDGSMEVEFPTFSLTNTELTDWAKKNIFTDDDLTDAVANLRRENLIKIVKGDKINISKEDLPFLEKLKNSLSTDMFGRREPEIRVLFTKDGSPTTEEIGVTFINYKK